MWRIYKIVTFPEEQLKINVSKIERRFGVVVTPFSRRAHKIRNLLNCWLGKDKFSEREIIQIKNF